VQQSVQLPQVLPDFAPVVFVLRLLSLISLIGLNSMPFNLKNYNLVAEKEKNLLLTAPGRK
jgi:hypothetical protein